MFQVFLRGACGKRLATFLESAQSLLIPCFKLQKVSLFVESNHQNRAGSKTHNLVRVHVASTLARDGDPAQTAL